MRLVSILCIMKIKPPIIVMSVQQSTYHINIATRRKRTKKINFLIFVKRADLNIFH